MEREWDEKEIELLQTSIDRYSFCLSLSHGPQRQTTITFYDPSDSPGKTGSHSPESGSRDQLHSVERGEELREQMKAALLQLGAMLSSPHLGGLKGKVQLLRSSLQQVCELFSLLLLTQSKVKSSSIMHTQTHFIMNIFHSGRTCWNCFSIPSPRCESRAASICYRLPAVT